ncbi:MAG TPA: TolC family protein [Terracidiphilus sp.]|nr:TolC family protein [Terracidiphilus sp.]
MKERSILLLLPLLLGVALPGTRAFAQAVPLTLHQAIGRALGQNPQAVVAQADASDASAAAALARTSLLPQLSFTEDISRGNDPVYVFGERLRQQQFSQANFALNELNRPEPIGNFASRFSGSWLLFDSLKTEKQIRQADLYKQASGSAANAADQQIVLHVVDAYQSVLYAQREVDVAQHEEQTAEALLAQVDDHVKAGLAVESDRMAAQVNLAARKQELISAHGDLDLAWAGLSDAMGDPDLQPSALNPIEPRAFADSSLEEELAAAAKTRPDLIATGDAQQAQEKGVSAARSDFGPRVSAYGNWEEDRSAIAGNGGNNWVAGVQVSIDILPIGKRDQLARAKAAKQRSDAQLAQQRSQVRLEVSRAHIERQTAALSLETAHAAMDQSTESLRIVKNRYNAGLATITDLLRAEDAERESQSSYWRAVYGNTRAYAQLLFAEGKLTSDAAEELE